MVFGIGLEFLEDVSLIAQPHAHLELGVHKELRVVRVRLLYHYLLDPYLMGMELCLDVGPEVPARRNNSTSEAAIGTVSRAERGMYPTLTVGMRGVNSTDALRCG